MADKPATQQSILDTQQKTADLNLAAAQRAADAAAAKTSPQTLEEKIQGATEGFQFMHFLFMTEHSVEQFQAAKGKIPDDISKSLKTILPKLIEFGILDEAAVNAGVVKAIDELKGPEIADFVLKGMTRKQFNGFLENDGFKKALAEIVGGEIKDFTVAEALTASGTKLDFKHDITRLVGGRRKTEIKETVDLRDTLKVGDKSIFDMTIKELTPEKIGEIFGTLDEKGTLQQSGSFSGSQVQNLITSLPASDVQKAIDGVLSKDGNAIEGLDAIKIPENATRTQIAEAFGQALDQRAIFEIENAALELAKAANAPDASISDTIMATLGSVMKPFRLSAIGKEAFGFDGARNEVVQNVSAKFGQELSTELKSVQKLDLTKISPEALFKMAKGLNEDDSVDPDAQAKLREKLENPKNVALLQATLKENVDGKLTLFMDLMPEKFDQTALEMFRENLNSGNGFLGALGPIIGKIMTAVMGFLGKNAPDIAQKLDVVAVKAEQDALTNAQNAQNTQTNNPILNQPSQ